MNRAKNSLVALACVAATSIAGSAYAADGIDPLRFDSGDDTVSFQAGIGYTFLKSNELVYDAAGNRISHLIWESDAPVLTAKGKAKFYGNWTVGGSVTLGGFGNSFMEDYDWLQGNYNFDDWTHQSLHPDTDLDLYLDLDVAVGHDFRVTDNATINLHGGFKYTNVKWASYGGSYIYSSGGGFRNDIGNFPDVPAISWEQRMPGFFLGAEASAKSGNWTFTGLARGGLTLDSQGIDHHWMRDLRFIDRYDAIPFMSLGAQVDYAFGNGSSVFLAGNFDNYFHKKGDTSIYDIPTGAQVAGPLVDGGGMSFRALTLSGGFKMAF